VISKDIPVKVMPELADAFDRDARALRALVSEHGASSGSSPTG